MTCIDPTSIPLELALEVCRKHGIAFQGRPQRQRQRRLRRRWRVEFLEELREHRKKARTMELLGLSFKTVYDEIAAETSFAEAVEMAAGQKEWDEQLWRRALERAQQKEAEIVDSTDTSRSGLPR